MNQAVAYVFGGSLAPNITGIVRFSDVEDGFIKIDVNINGIKDGVYGFHIHEKGVCQEGNIEEPFAATGPHYNPTDMPHGFHSGDLPVLIPSSGRARMVFYTTKFCVNDVVGRSVLIHQDTDDYRTQPSGNSGMKIACGIIRRVVNGKKYYSE